MALPAQDGKVLVNTFKDRPLTEHPSGWDNLWKQNFTPWDRGGPSLALADLLTGRSDLVPSPATTKKRALVPGCGRGYDVLLLTSLGYDVVGLDYSDIAISEAKETQNTVGKEDIYQARDGVTKGEVTWATGNFFEDAWLNTTGATQFDLIFDYTFFCALPPSARPGWAKRMSGLLAPEGRLVCLEWPLSRPLTSGPPWGLTGDFYVAQLSRPGVEVPYDDQGRLALAQGEEVQAAGSDPSALKRLERIKPARTHKAGYDDDGNLTDFISVWGH